MQRRHQSITWAQASMASPTFAKLSELVRDSAQRLKAIEPLIPPMLRSAIQAGPIEGTTWCLLLNSNAAAAKLRQQLPAFEAHLRSRGWEVTAIRLKVQNTNRR
ncbi:hypothetical protein PSQ20_08490 [Curvibacter sp. RS43]|jgi:hypothetical protein|uniref:DUF721 domain-containing protein n=1 Tax=Curvibacter microcysteis TaxID=3026419 RepID=A0ABT5MIB3_9BURK|nr:MULTISPECIES: hypothetical protein [unclassified Curvibacter]MDD0810370.1 hypothetical protein [Curvibacter sp. RS43]MDD0816324.1 hypothetical protein [Curvibacter sp. HBC28]